MGRFAQGIYEVKNLTKYVGKKKPTYRSGWELDVFRFCDANPNILEWASEPIRIPYFNPIKGRKTTYVPDILLIYKDKLGKQRTELIEIKPKKQSFMTEGLSVKERTVVQINHLKWKAAVQWCKQHNIVFRVITEDQLYHNGKR